MKSRLRLSAAALATAVLALATTPGAHACAVCFGESDSPLARGLHWGVIALLLIVGAVLTGFACFAVHLVRRAERIAADTPAPPAPAATTAAPQD